MPSKLSELVEEKLRQFLTDNLDTAAMQGYNPKQTDETATDFMPVTSSWSKWGDTYPIIYVAEDSGPQVPNSGNTNANGKQGATGKNNQYAIHNVTISVQVVEGGAYLNGTEYDALAQDIYSEVHETIQNNTTALNETLWLGIPTPPTPNRNPGEDDSDTLDWFQLQGTAPIGVHYTP